MHDAAVRKEIDAFFDEFCAGAALRVETLVFVDIGTILATAFAIFGLRRLAVRASVFFIGTMACLGSVIVTDKTTVAKGEPFVFTYCLHKLFGVCHSIKMIGIII